MMDANYSNYMKKNSMGLSMIEKSKLIQSNNDLYVYIFIPFNK